jgi:thioredoxin-related protein
MIRTVITALLLVFSVPLAAQETAADTTLPKAAIQWLLLEEAETLHRDTPKNFLFLVYSEDCHWCQKMLQETFSDSSVVEKINTRFYPVRLTMTKAGQFFISSMLLNDFNVQNYPAIFFFSDNFQPTTNVSGFQSVEEFMPYLMYAGEPKYYQYMKFDEFKKTWATIQALKTNRKE